MSDLTRLQARVRGHPGGGPGARGRRGAGRAVAGEGVTAARGGGGAGGGRGSVTRPRQRAGGRAGRRRLAPGDAARARGGAARVTWGCGPGRGSPRPALEALAIVAYRQPITLPEINFLRGVSSAGVVRTLLERKLIGGGGAQAGGRARRCCTGPRRSSWYTSGCPICRLCPPGGGGDGGGRRRPVALERVQKLIARAGVCSRRDAEALIREGRVTINGGPPTWAPGRPREGRGQGRRQAPRPPPSGCATFLFYKPVKRDDHDRRPRGPADGPRLLPARQRSGSSRSGGWTTAPRGSCCSPTTASWRCASSHPRYGVLREYMAKVKGVPDARDVEPAAARHVASRGSRSCPTRWPTCAPRPAA